MNKTNMEDDIYISLIFRNKSCESIKFIQSLLELIQKEGVKSRKSNLLKALPCIAVGLLRAKASSKTEHAYRPMSTASFTGESIGHMPFKAAIDGLVSAGHITFVNALKPAVDSIFNPAMASRFQGKSKFFELADAYGIKPEEWDQHFVSLPMPSVVHNPIIVRTDSSLVAVGKGRKIKKPSENMRVDPADPFVIEESKRINEINASLSEQDIQPAYLVQGFQRIFSNGNLPGFNWNAGGRLYAIGGGYQQEPGSERLKMTINGEPVVEIDIRASHLTILHALKGVPLPGGDPYDIPGIPRLVVKSWVAMTLGHDKLPGNKWSTAAKSTYAKMACGFRNENDEQEELCRTVCKGHCLQRLYPMAKTGPKIASHFPILDDWAASPHRWEKFQFLESQAIIDAVHTLATRHGIPALPVHDSLIVPVSKQEVAERTLSDAFYKHIRVMPVLSVKLSASV